MKKRIYRHMMLLTLVSLLLLAALLSMVFYNVISRDAKKDLQEKAVLLLAVSGAEPGGFKNLAGFGLPQDGTRVTVISATGEVLQDSVATPDALESHAAREEFLEAMDSGTGESTRFSTTLGTWTYYYALRLSDGHVLRLARTIASIHGMLLNAVPLLLLVCLVVFLLGNIIASRIAQSITRPIHTMDPQAQAPVYDELSPWVRTISSQKDRIALQEKDISHQANMIELVTANMREGFLLLDQHANILLANPFVCSLFGAEGDMRGKNIVELLHQTDILENVKLAIAGEHRVMATAVGEHMLRIFYTPSPDSGAMLMFLDVTEMTHAERMRAEFSANVSHELKTPLTSIYGIAQMLSQGLVQEGDVTRFAGKIETETLRLIRLVDDIIKLSALDEAVQKPSMQPVNISALAKEVAQRLDMKAESFGVTLSVPEGALHITANHEMMEEVLFNLLDNAIQYNKPGGRAWVAVSTDAEDAIIEVCDTGIGISRTQQERVFERFYRVDKSRSKKIGGTGLGLAIVKHMVLIHGGSVEVLSEEGRGTTVRVRMPWGNA